MRIYVDHDKNFIFSLLLYRPDSSLFFVYGNFLCVPLSAEQNRVAIEQAKSMADNYQSSRTNRTQLSCVSSTAAAAGIWLCFYYGMSLWEFNL